MNQNSDYSDDKVNMALFTPLALFSIATAVLLAWTMDWLFARGLHQELVVPIVFGMVLVGLVKVSISKGKCRNPKLGCLLGLVVATVMYIGFYHAGVVRVAGIEKINRIDWLPKYLVSRSKKIAFNPNNIPKKNKQKAPIKKTIDIVFFWVLFATEYIIILLLCGTAGYLRSRWACCEKCASWMEHQYIVYPPDSANYLVTSLNSGELEKWKNNHDAEITFHEPATIAMVEYCSHCGDKVYLSIKDAKLLSTFGSNHFISSPGELLLFRKKLTKDIITKLAPFFSSLKPFTNKAQLAAIIRQSQPTEYQTKGSLAVISSVEGHAGKVLNQKSKRWSFGLFIFYLFLMFFLVAITLSAAVAGFCFIFIEQMLIEGSVLAAAGILFSILSFAIWAKKPAVLSDNYTHRLLSQQIQMRSMRLVEPDNPKATIVRVIPRKNWRIMLDCASDIGYLLVDENKEEMLFEGDKERYQIPFVAIENCELISPSVGCIVMLKVHTNEGSKEIPLCSAALDGKNSVDLRNQKTQNLCEKILTKLKQ